MIQKKAALLTLGCRLNQADSALLSARLARMGFEIVDLDSVPENTVDLIVVNTCSVTGTAFKKSRHTLKTIRAGNPGAFIVLTGCAVNVDKDALEHCDEYDLLLNNEEKKEIERILPLRLSWLPAPQRPAVAERAGTITAAGGAQEIFHEDALALYPFKSRAVLKIQEGCDNFCSYCIVPYARGRERSRDWNETLSDFQRFVGDGFKEIVLSGVNICNYRCEGRDLVALLERLLEIPGDFRIRLSSTEPGPILPRLIRTIAQSEGRICQFLHLPLQNGSDRVLKAMGRKYLSGEYASFVEEARALLPRIHIGSDLIVGFPGETAADFEEGFHFMERISFANVHVFPFSPRKGTPAEKMKGRVMGRELETRLERMKKLKEEMQLRFRESLIGTEERVLVEVQRKGGLWEGWSGNYVRTRIRYHGTLSKQLCRVRFRALLPDGSMEAELLSASDAVGIL